MLKRRERREIQERQDSLDALFMVRPVRRSTITMLKEKRKRENREIANRRITSTTISQILSETGNSTNTRTTGGYTGNRQPVINSLTTGNSTNTRTTGGYTGNRQPVVRSINTDDIIKTKRTLDENIKNYFLNESSSKKWPLFNRWNLNEWNGRSLEDNDKYSKIDVNNVSGSYCITITDSTVDNPFIISPELIRISKRETEGKRTLDEKARAIFNWIERNISYGTSKRIYGYKNSREALNDKEGVCGEMAFVYIAMARAVGLNSSYVSVEIDYKGKKVCHGCAMVNIGYRNILVDPAYHTYDIKHIKYTVKNDSEIISLFKEWRQQQDNMLVSFPEYLINKVIRFLQ